MAQWVKNSLAEQDTQVPSLVGKTPWRRERLPTQDPGLENSMGCIVHGVAKSQTDTTEQLSHSESGYELRLKPSPFEFS